MNTFLYIEGIRVSFSSISIDQNGATISLAGDVFLVPKFSHVQFFIEFNGIQILLFDGFVVGSGRSLGVGSLSCIWSFNALNLSTIGIIHPNSIFAYAETITSNVTAETQISQTSPLYNPMILIQKGVDKIFSEFYKKYIEGEGDTQESGVAILKHKLIKHNIAQFNLLKKVKVFAVERFTKLAQFNTFMALINSMATPEGSFPLGDYLRSYFQLMQYFLTVQYAPPTLNNLYQFMPLFLSASVPKCNVFTSPIVQSKSIVVSRNYASKPTRAVQFTSFGNVKAPVAVLPEGLTVENFHDTLTQEEMEGLVLPTIFEANPFMAGLVSKTDEPDIDGNERTYILEFWKAMAEYQFFLARASSITVSFSCAFQPFALINFPAAVTTIQNEIFTGLLSGYNISIAANGTFVATVSLSPVFEETPKLGLYSDIPAIAKSFYKSIGTAELTEIPQSIMYEQDDFYAFVQRKTVSIGQFLTELGGDGDVSEYNYPGLSKKRKEKIKAFKVSQGII